MNLVMEYQLLLILMVLIKVQIVMVMISFCIIQVLGISYVQKIRMGIFIMAEVVMIMP